MLSFRFSATSSVRSSCRFCSTTASAAATGSPSSAAASSEPEPKPETAEQLARRLRKDTDREVYEPGAFARGLRSVVVAVTGTFKLQQRVAKRIERGLKEVERLEKEQKWLRRHGSPLRVLGLPETADLEDIKVRYRNLLFEVHPDTAPRGDKAALVKAGLTEEKARERQMEEFELLKAAYQIATSPNSLWHQDGNAPALLREMQGPGSLMSRVITPHNALPLVAYLCGFAVCVLIFSVAGYYALVAALQAADPVFYKFLTEQEAEEKRKREAGEVVDTDPKRLAPKKMLRIAEPGKMVSATVVPDEDEFEDVVPVVVSTSK
jgi:hypothetical protein